MLNHLTATIRIPAIGTRLFFTVQLAFCLVLLLNIDIKAQRTNRQRPVSVSESKSIRIAVLPFRNSFARRPSQDEIVSVLGDGIADSLTNALKSNSGIYVIDIERVLQAAARFPNAEINNSDEDALRIADSLSVQIIVRGSFQFAKNHLHVDVRMLMVGAGSAVSLQPITADGNYPDDYSLLLRKLLTSIVGNLKKPLSKLTQNEQTAFTGTNSTEAYRFYLLGIKLARTNKADELSKAIGFFDKALSLDPDFADALAAKSEAEMKLYRLKKEQGHQDDAVAEAARRDAINSLRASPGSGRGYRALGEAEEALGDRDAAARSRAAAKTAWPGDATVSADLSRSFQDGKLVRSVYTDMMFLRQPELALLFHQLPKILVRNDSQYSLTIRFVPLDGRPYPAVTLSPGSNRIVPIFPGRCRLIVESQVGNLEEDADFQEGQDYEYQYSAHSFPLGKFTFVNDGDYTVQIRVSGRPSTSLVLRARETKSIAMPPGVYSVTARVLTAVKTETYELNVGEEETITCSYSVGRVPVFDPAELTILNGGNAPLAATIIGPRRYTITVPPGGKTTTLPAGNYRIAVACGREVDEAGEYELLAGSETTLSDYSCNRRYRYVVR